MPEKLKKICSQCGSESLKPAVAPWRAYATAFGQYKCLGCGFEGIAILADEKSAEKIRKKLKAKLGINKN
ncbi:MAG: hypothetical protein PHD95_01085 [Candidatus ainarchaeum sp.]|nr:hypothetical protein [Candidatus ainarchaeum sp.]